VARSEHTHADKGSEAHHQHPEGAAHQHDLHGASRRSLWIALALITSYMLIEIGGGLIGHSLALLADGGHMISDVAAIGLALLAMWMATRPASFKRTFGFHRTEILAALLNALSLWLIAAWIFIEAYRRFLNPPQVQGELMLSVGFVGLLVNLGALPLCWGKLERGGCLPACVGRSAGLYRCGSGGPADNHPELGHSRPTIWCRHWCHHFI
jgi:cobalt-zinc-cadmium efflux system protein